LTLKVAAAAVEAAMASARHGCPELSAEVVAATGPHTRAPRGLELTSSRPRPQAESLLTLTNIVDVIGLKATLDMVLSHGGGGGSSPDDPAGTPASTSTVLASPPFVGLAALGLALAALTTGTGSEAAGPFGLGAHSPFLNGVGNLPAGLWPLGEPVNALSLPCWIIHFSSLFEVSLYTILFYFKALLWESIILLLPPPHLQSLPYCNTIARPLRNIRPATDPPCKCHTPYNIGDGNIV